MKAKKLFRFIKLTAAALAAAITFTACSQGGDTSSGSESSVPEEPYTTAKVGYIYDRTVARDNITYMFEKSRHDLETALEIETCYVENVAVSQLEDAVKALKNEGCTIIVTASHIFANSVYSYAKNDKDMYFLSYGGNATLSNLTTFSPKLYQPAFVCGTVAAWNSSSHAIGVVADHHMFSAIGVIDAFILGTQQIYKPDETNVKVMYASTPEQTQQAVAALDAEGCDVIFSYQSDDHCMYYCDMLGIKSIGFTNDIDYSAPKYGLTGYYLNWATFITDTIRTCLNDNYLPESYVGGINEAFVKMTPYSANCKKETITIADTLYNYVKRGNAKIFEGEIRNMDGIPKVGAGAVLTDREIFSLDYLVYGVTSLTDLTEPVANPVYSDLTIKTEYVS